jgi:hypothetical protein
MPVHRYRSVEEMPPPWRDADDPTNLRRAAEMMAIHRRLTGGPRERLPVQRFRTIEEAALAREQAFRRPGSR